MDDNLLKSLGLTDDDEVTRLQRRVREQNDRIEQQRDEIARLRHELGKKEDF